MPLVAQCRLPRTGWRRTRLAARTRLRKAARLRPPRRREDRRLGASCQVWDDVAQGWSGRMRRTVGSHVSSWASTLFRWVASRLARSFPMAAGSPARRPGLPPTRPRRRAACSPALVRSAISARSSWATAPSTWESIRICGVVRLRRLTFRPCCRWRARDASARTSTGVCHRASAFGSATGDVHPVWSIASAGAWRSAC